MKIIETDRLSLRRFTHNDVPFIFKLLNEPGWLRFIGDRGIVCEEDARSYIETALIASYRKYGYGLYAIDLKEGNIPVGMCGLVKRDWLDNADLGFALCSCYQGMGYATEAAQAVLDYAKNMLELHRVLAVTSGDNDRSKNLLNNIGMTYKKTMTAPGEESLLDLYSINLACHHE